MNDFVRTRSFTATVKVKFSKGQGADDRYRALRAFAQNPAVLAKLMRAAIQASFLAAYKRRFEAQWQAMALMEGGPAEKPKPRKTAWQAKLRDAEKAAAEFDLKRNEQTTRELKVRGSQFPDEREVGDDAVDQFRELTAASVRGELGMSVSGPRRRRRAKQDFQGSRQDNVLYKQGTTNRERYEQRMGQILELISERAKVHVLRGSKGGVTVSAVNIRDLSLVKNPPFVELLDPPRSSRSPFRTFWRHLEFGTGQFREGGEKQPAVWYHSGLAIVGSHPGHFLKTARGVPYGEDALQFEQLFERYMRRALGG